ncbi:DNA recombination protein RmuC [bacterium]|jgi:DNA recombination protein RmuC|nr:DNA recombination protein RmuC [bacterium]
MEAILGFIVGLLLGGGAIWTWFKKTQQDQSHWQTHLQNTFENLSESVLAKNTDHFLTVVQEKLSKQTQLHDKELDNKKGLIDQTLTQMNTQVKEELGKLHQSVRTFERDREVKYGELSQHLKTHAEQTRHLMDTTSQLKEALSSSKTRGLWGERMAEDILRLSDLKEGINYIKQTSLDNSRSIPDYTFLLPENKKVNMDVKFPLTNYLNYLNAPEASKDQFKSQFLKDVKQRINEVANKDYINPENNTLDYVLVFIPNEQIYSFIQESAIQSLQTQSNSIADYAMEKRVILCSPFTLYALLSIMHQVINTFSLEQRATEILQLMGTFEKQWDMFNDSVKKIGTHIQRTQNEYTELTGKRKRQLEKPLNQIKQLRESLPQEEIPTLKNVQDRVTITLSKED